MQHLLTLLAQVSQFQPAYLDNSAWTGHLPFAGWIVQSKKPKVLVELGTHGGSSYFAFCQAVQESHLDTRCYAVDTWDGDEHAGLYEKTIFQTVSNYNNSHYGDFSTLLKKTFDEALSDIANQSVDLLHIDGLHTYEAVKHDFETWRPKLKPGAVVLFHDTCVKDTGFGVWRFWEELKDQYPLNFEMHHAFGLGVLQMPCSTPEETLTWIQQNDSFKSHLSKSFAALGQFQQARYESSLTLQHVKNQDGIIESSNQKSDTLSKQVESLDENFQALSLAHQALSSAHQALSSAHHSMLSSTSWKMTRPLRWMGHVIRQNLRFFWFLYKLIKSKGGVLSLVFKALQVLKNEGASGLLFKILLTLSPQKHRAAANSEGHDQNDYAFWVKKYDTLSDEQRASYKREVSTWTHTPLISVIMPTYNSPIEFLRQAIESVEKQIYPHWELCIADDCSIDLEVRRLLEEKSISEPRIKLCFREKNGHISAASNSALELASGSWAALFDHDDLLSEDALFFVARHITRHPEAQIIYSDEDKVDEQGQRFSPHFKSDWNPELFFTQNYLSHLGVYQTSLLRAIGGFRLGLEGSQDHDLVLRCLPHVQKGSIHHLPKVLYHWRAIAGSTALNASAKSYADEARHRALMDYFKTQGMSVKVSPGLIANTAKIEYPIPTPAPWVTLLIPTRDRLDLIEPCVRSILNKTLYPNFDIIILDNASLAPQTLTFFKGIQEEDSRVKVVRDDSPFNFSAINNRGVKLARGSIVGLINNDIEVISEQWLTEMVSFCIQKDIGCVGAKLYYPNDTLQHGGVILGIKGVANHAYHKYAKHHDGYFGRLRVPQVLSAVTAACLLVRKDVYLNVGGMNEEDLKIAFNDIDFCLKVRALGYRNVWTPYAELYHHESVSRGTEDTPEKKARFATEVDYMKHRWGQALEQDPYYNPNLTLEEENFSLAWGPRAHPYLKI